MKSRIEPLPPVVLESSAKIGRPIVSQRPSTSGRAIASGVKRDRGTSTARGAGSRPDGTWVVRRMRDSFAAVLLT
jgi:hypothetical protein